MGAEIERTSSLPTLIIDCQNGLEDLRIAHEIASRVDELNSRTETKTKMGIMLQLTPTSENSTKSNLLITGTDIQLDIFKRAIKVREVAVRDGNVGLALEAKVRQFFCLQRLRLPV